MKITKEKDEAVIRIPLWQIENNCYIEEEKLGRVHNLIGVITKEKNGNDLFSISHLCDLSYKGTQQEGSPIIMFYSKKELINACKILGLSIWENEDIEEIVHLKS